MTLPPFMTTSRTALPPNSQFNFEELEQSAVKTLVGLEQGLSATETLASIDNVVIMLMDSRSVSPTPEAVAADIVGVSLKDFPMTVARKAATPPPSPTRSEAVTTKKVPTARSKMTSKPKKASLLPTKNDPMDPSFRMSLHSDEDKGKINIVHVAIRRYVLDVRRTVTGRVYLQCSFCTHLPRSERARCSTVAPQRIEGLYRSMVRFSMNHLNACNHVPPKIKAMSPKSFSKHAKDGIKRYWISSAYALGLANGDNVIIVCPEATY